MDKTEDPPEGAGSQIEENGRSPSRQKGWRIGESMPLELDVVLWLIDERGQQPLARLPAQWHVLMEQLDPAWLAECPDYYGTRTGPTALLERIAEWAGVLHEADYSRATLAMRTLTLAEALAVVRQQAEAAEVLVSESGPPAEQLATLTLRLVRQQYGELGLSTVSPGELASRVRAEVAAARAVLRDGGRHAHFWHWLDRFYYETYRPWREAQSATLTALRAEAIAALGAAEGAGAPPVSWLPGQNPLRYRPELAKAVASGDLDVFFWVEPLGLVDIWFLFSEQVVVGLARPGEVYENFRAYAEEVAGRTKALSDPTRLLILRLIRNLSMDNTSMADFLEVTRPTVSVHTRILREAGLIRTRQVGRQAQHEILPAAIQELFRDLAHFLDLPAGGEEE